MLASLILAALLAQAPMPNLAPGGDTALSVRPLYTAAGATVNVTYNRSGPNGCYRQSGAGTTIAGTEITHAYKTWYEGEFCTEALVRGGFSASFVAPAPGVYQGRVLMNDAAAAGYTLRVFATPSEADRAMQTDAATFDDWTLQQMLGAMTPEQKPLAKALVPRIRTVLAGQPATPLWYAVLQFLGTTPHLDVLRAVRTELAAAPEQAGTAYAYHKWIVLARITPDKELARQIEQSACTYSGPADAIFTAAKDHKTPGLCAPIRKAAQRIRKECNRWHNGYAALLATPACRNEVVTLLNDAPPDYAFLAQLESQAGQEPYKTIIRNKLPAWHKGLTGEFAESYRQILQRLENAVK